MILKIEYRFQILNKLRPMARGIQKLFVIDCMAAVAVMMLALARPFFYRVFFEDVILGGNLSY